MRCPHDPNPTSEVFHSHRIAYSLFIRYTYAVTLDVEPVVLGISRVGPKKYACYAHDLKKMPKSDLPFGSEFSPSQISLPKVLEFAQQHGGNWKSFEMAIRVAYFQSHKTSDYNKGKLANNTKLGMQAYGIIDDKASLTVFGKELFTLRKDEKRLYEALAKHILLNLHGSTLVQCVQDIQAGGAPVTLNTLREWLLERGIVFPRGG